MTEETSVKEDQNPVENNVNVENTVNTGTESAEETVVEEKSETEILTDKYNEVNDKYLRLYSDFENFRKQKTKERIELIQTAGADVLKNLLSVLDDFERAIQANEKIEDITVVKDGFNLIHAKLKSTLERQGLKEIVAIGESFDTDLHEALTNIPTPSNELKGKVVDVAEKGYFLNEKVIRFAKVIVGQ